MARWQGERVIDRKMKRIFKGLSVACLLILVLGLSACGGSAVSETVTAVADKTPPATSGAEPTENLVSRTQIFLIALEDNGQQRPSSAFHPSSHCKHKNGNSN